MICFMDSFDHFSYNMNKKVFMRSPYLDVAKKIKEMSQEEFIISLINTGIIDEYGNLTPEYTKGDKKPRIRKTEKLVNEMDQLKSRVGKDKTVKFVYYCSGELWYVCEDGFEFPVPIKDTSNGVFKATDKAILFMRYVRQHMDLLKQARLDANIT